MSYPYGWTLAGVLLLASLGPATHGGWFEQTFRDPVDGRFDTSNWLLNKKGALPVPIIITEPAIGYGGGVALAYFHRKPGMLEKGGRPSISAAGAAATENGTGFAGGGHLGIWRDDSVRYKGFAGLGRIRMDYYGIGRELDGVLDRGIEFTTDAAFLLQELQFRLFDSDFFAGASYTFVDTGNAFSLKRGDQPLPGLPGIDFDSRAAALGLILEYDDRDNMLTPATGTHAQLKAQFFDSAWGGDDDFQRYGGFVKHYVRFDEQWLLGMRADAESVRGDAPFYSYPFIMMRGIKAMRYQGEQTLLAEAELNWVFDPRWTVVGFAGVGKAFGRREGQSSDLIFSRGLGIRYLIASRLGLKMGRDIARGPEDTAFYIVMGNAWTF